ncbi:MAG: hypothetical protein ABGY96_23820 [bacterium]|nr:hypothetical protein [Gammaproteobacteria bacterium]HIL95077.1 hypothetical protein [Pseudomonadales bacterium]
MNSAQKKKTRLLLQSTVAIVGLFFLTGNVSIVSGTGRYQLESWGFSSGAGTGMYGAFVIDTATGTTQIVYQAEITPKSRLVMKNLLGKHFNAYSEKTIEDGRSIKEANKLYKKATTERPR